MSQNDRLAVLDGALGRGYEEFDGLIIAERARARQQSNEVGSDPGGLNEESSEGTGGGQGQGQGQGQDRQGGGRPAMPGDGQDGGDGQVIARGGQDGQPQAGGSGASTGGLQGGPAGEQSDEDTYPVPEDIPEGRDDDVVARQIREAAMNESDPELREALWDEYRRYTGLEE